MGKLTHFESLFCISENSTRVALKLPLVVLLLVSLTGCGSILDPAPYRPYDGTSLDTGNGTAISGQGVLQFNGLDDARTKLFAMSTGYSNEQDALSRQQLAFDIPAIGLGVASLVSLSFHGAANATTGLGLAAGTVYGSKTYFEPGVKITAYNSAAQSLFCAGTAAGDLDDTQGIYRASGETILGGMTVDIANAGNLLDGTDLATLSTDQKTALQTARDYAQKSATDLAAALQVFEEAPGKLQDFALATISKTTNTVSAGAPDPASVIKAVQAGIMPATVPAANAAKPAPNAGMLAAQEQNAVSQSDAVSLADKLTTDVSNADTVTKAVNTSWALFTACTTAN